jgi:hypothetical protein
MAPKTALQGSVRLRLRCAEKFYASASENPIPRGTSALPQLIFFNTWTFPPHCLKNGQER